MPLLFPFKALRPPTDKAHLVASRSFITYDKSELADKLKGNPFTFLHVVNPEASEGLSPTKNTQERFEMVKLKFDEWVSKDYFHRDEAPGFYIYRQIQENIQFSGIIGCTSVKDYVDGKIKIHEHTLTEREDVFKVYLDKTNFHAEPVLLTYPDHEQINAIIKNKQKVKPDFDFSTTDKIRHSLWLVQSSETINLVQKYFSEIEAFYIADGHHRSASSLKLAEMRQGQKGNLDGMEAHNFFMSLLIPDCQLHIEPFHRLVKDLNGLSKNQLLTVLEKHFFIKKLESETSAKPSNKHHFGMYIEGVWFELKLKDQKFLSGNIVDQLDTQILTDKILIPILGIMDIKTDTRISCIGGKEGGCTIKKAVDSGKYAVGFWLFPVAVNQMMEIADKHLIMPPKSTWVEPKLRSGLTVFTFEKGETIN